MTENFENNNRNRSIKELNAGAKKNLVTQDILNLIKLS